MCVLSPLPGGDGGGSLCPGQEARSSHGVCACVCVMDHRRKRNVDSGSNHSPLVAAARPLASIVPLDRKLLAQQLVQFTTGLTCLMAVVVKLKRSCWRNFALESIINWSAQLRAESSVLLMRVIDWLHHKGQSQALFVGQVFAYVCLCVVFTVGFKWEWVKL